MSTETIEIFNNSDEWANQLKHALSKGENLALLHGLTPDILDRIYAYAFDYHEKGNITDAEIYYKFLCIYAFENHEYLKDFASVCQPKEISTSIWPLQTKLQLLPVWWLFSYLSYGSMSDWG